MPHEPAPPEIQALAEQRAEARRARDWALADRLKAEIEDAGWRVIDAATLWSLERAHAPTLVDEDRVRYGTSAAVPSRLDDAPVGLATVVVVATDWPEDVARAVGALADHGPDGTQLVIVGNAPSAAQAAALEALDRADPGAPGMTTEVVWTGARLGHAAALNAGIRRAAAPVVIVLDASLEPRADLVTPLVRALDDPTVAVAGPYGLRSPDLRRFTEAPEDALDVDAIEGYALAFRRDDYATRGPLDEHFDFYRSLDIWWSLVLREESAWDEVTGEPLDRPRRAVRAGVVPAVRHEHRGWASLPEAERERRSKRNLYRVLKRFATRRDLLVGSQGS